MEKTVHEAVEAALNERMAHFVIKLQCLIDQTAERGPTSGRVIQEEVITSPPPPPPKGKAFKPKAKGKDKLRTSTKRGSRLGEEPRGIFLF
ncbi:hypothetical protein ACJMK2_033284 [Sinanodonta woodiana]|uniref:Uncharacterized protein n=1 Tax=Sinanodonta woodiana TaxID=1069815 RepID=A0ABD3WPR2_SINWO